MNDMMDMGNDQQSDIQTIPRINGEMLQSGQFNGSHVSIVGKFIGQVNNDQTLNQFEASDGKRFRVKVNTQQPFNGYNQKFIEIRGTAQNGQMIFQQSHQEWGNEFHMENWNTFVKMCQHYSNIF